MPRDLFERELRRLNDDILILGSMAEKAILQSVDMLVRADLAGSQELIADDLKINQKRFAIETDCLHVIATQQPMASDLRTLAAVLELATELERIGDYGKGIARITLMLGDNPPVKPFQDIPLMAEKACSMLHRSLDAWTRRDVELARAIPLQDDEIDALYNHVYHELIDIFTTTPRAIDAGTPLLWVAHNLERAGDRCSNICERTIFMVTGQMAEFDMGQMKDVTIT
jgi:phosphate transport system protein